MKRIDCISESWEDYELLDSGSGRKLERFGEIVLIRPEVQALWKPRSNELWKTAHAEFQWKDGGGAWVLLCDVPETWTMSWNGIRFLLRLTNFKHTGVFPEHALNWKWIDGRVRGMRDPLVLNLFGYSGIATLVATLAGAHVTHLDASKTSIAWAKENATLARAPENAIRYMLDDAAAFVRREVRRGSRYDGIILDPPAFGRGPKGEVWHIETDLAPLMEALAVLLSESTGSFLLLSGYAAGFSSDSFGQLASGIFPDASEIEYGELDIKETNTERVVSAGIYTRVVQ